MNKKKKFNRREKQQTTYMAIQLSRLGYVHKYNTHKYVFT